MHPSLLSLVLALGVFDPSPHVDVTSVVHFKPVHDGFLLVRHPNTGEVFYSHGGTFHLDGQGRLLDDADMALLTVKLNAAAGNASWEDLRLPLADLDTPHASAMMAWRGNLDPFAAVLRFDPAHPAVTSNFAAHATVYDALGGHHDVAVYFNAGGTEKERIVYRWVAMTDPNALYDPNMPMAPTPDIGDASQDPAAPTTAAAAADPNVSDANGLKRDVFGQVGQGRIQFHRNGTLAEVLNANFTVHFANLPEPQTVKLDFGKPVDLRHNGRSGLTAFTGQEVQAHVTQDGYRHRWVTAVSELDINGTLMAVLSDGAMVPLDPVVMARFYNMHGMALIQNDLFAANDQSGPPNLTLATCADMVTTVIFKDATDGSVARVEPALGDCPLMPQPWQKVAAAPGTYFALEGEHAGHLGVYLAKEVDLRLIAGEPLQESRERLKLQAVAPIAGDTDSAIAAGGLVVPQATDLLSPKMTTAIVLTGNLDASNPPRTMDPYHLQNSANTSMAVAVYDHTGAPHQLRFDFYAHAKAETDAVPHHRYLWIATFDPPSVESSDGSSELDASIADGLLQFNPNGTLRAPTTTTLDLPIGPGGTMVQQTLFFGEPPEVADPNVVEVNPAAIRRRAVDANQAPDAASSAEAAGTGDPQAETSGNANQPGAADPNAPIEVDPNAVLVLPAPLTSLPRATRLTDSYQDGWQPNLTDMQYGIDVCGVLSVGLPTGERLTLGTILVVKQSAADTPVLLNDWLYAWPGTNGPPNAQPAVCNDLVFDAVAD